MYPNDVTPLVGIVHPSEDLVDLAQYELERLGLSVTAIVPDPPEESGPILSFLTPAPLICVYGVAQPRPAALACFATVRQFLPATRFIAVTRVASRADVWPGGALFGVAEEADDAETTVARIVASVRRALNMPSAQLLRLPVLARRYQTVRSSTMETVTAARATRHMSEAIRLRLAGSHGPSTVQLQASPPPAAVSKSLLRFIR